MASGSSCVVSRLRYDLFRREGGRWLSEDYFHAHEQVETYVAALSNSDFINLKMRLIKMWCV